MSISRRDFLKNAGVAVLAVAAAGVLAGCSKDEIPEIPGVSKTVDILYYVEGKDKPVHHDRIMVPADAKTVAAADVKLPEYPVQYVDGKPVPATKKYAWAEVQTEFVIEEDKDNYPYNSIKVMLEVVDAVDAD